jgi:glycosyltransferase involved in cell wall biosynthesis
MKRRQGITLAICTRNRHDDLTRCIHSIALQNPAVPVEVLIVDDGEMSERMLTSFSAILNASLMEFNYHKKLNPGLLLSRIETIQRAKHDIILFVDDDVELVSGFLNRLSELYDRFPAASGIGGRDVLLGTSFIWRLFCMVFLYGSRKPGKLSLSGYGGSMIKWCLMKAPFKTEYLAGCNMSFRRNALIGLRPAVWLLGYSLGEDIYLSQCARRYGEIWIDPDLKVIHHQSLLSRDRAEQVAYTEVVNHYYLLREDGNKSWRYICLLWTSWGLLIRSLLRKNYNNNTSGYWEAIKFIVKHNWGRFAHESVVNHGNDQTYP